MMPGLLFVMQLLTALAALPVCVMSLMTSRRWRSRQHIFMWVSVALIVAALVGIMVTLVVASDPEDPDYWLALGTPFATFVLCGVTIWRSSRPISRGGASRSRGRIGPIAK